MLKLSVIVLVLGMAGCASVGVCDVPSANIVQGAYLVFDYDNAAKLGKLLSDLDSGNCKLPKDK